MRREKGAHTRTDTDILISNHTDSQHICKISRAYLFESNKKKRY